MPIGCAPCIKTKGGSPMPYAIHLRKSRADIEAEARGEGESL